MTEANTNHNWGGKREGAGRKKQPRTYSDKIKSRLMKVLKGKEKETGKCWLQDLVDMNQDTSVQDSVRIAAKKLISDMLVIRESHRTEEVLHYGPAILPVLEDDPSRIDISAPTKEGRQGKKGTERS